MSENNPETNIEQKEQVEIYIDPTLKGKYGEKAILAIAQKEQPDKEVVPIYEQKQPEEKKPEATTTETEVVETTEEKSVIETDATPTNLPDFTKFGEGVDTIDKAVEVLTKERTANEGYSKQIAELTKQLESVQNPFANDELKKLNELAKKSGRADLTVLGKLISTDVDTADAIDLLLLKEQLDNPKVDIRIARKALERMYIVKKPDDFDELEPSDQQEVLDNIELAQYKLSKDVLPVRQELKTIQTVEVDSTQTNYQELQQKKIELITPIVESMITEVVIPISIDKDFSVDFKFTPEMLLPYKEGMKNILLNNEPNEKTLEYAKYYAIREAIADNFDGILKAAIDKDRTARHQEKLKSDVVPESTKKEVVTPKTAEPHPIEKYINEKKANKNFV